MKINTALRTFIKQPFENRNSVMQDSDDDVPLPKWQSKRATMSFANIPRPVKRSKSTPTTPTAPTAPTAPTTPTTQAVDGASASIGYINTGDAVSTDRSDDLSAGLTHGADRDEDEVGDSNIELLLNNFVEVHPMCAATFNDNEALRLLTKLPSKGQIPEMQVIPRSYDNSMLRPPDEAVGERPCVNDKRCFCYFLGKLRHGEEDPRTFVCTEYLLPKEQKAWREGSMRLKECRTKCLICKRYYMHATFLRINTEPDFRASMSGKMLQEFRNDIATQTCNVETNDGYPKSRLLSVNDKDGLLEPVTMFPFVGFNTKNYQMKLDDKGRPFAAQLNMIPRSDLNGQPSIE